jgi:hypothetical protein
MAGALAGAHPALGRVWLHTLLRVPQSLLHGQPYSSLAITLTGGCFQDQREDRNTGDVDDEHVVGEIMEAVADGRISSQDVARESQNT